MYLNKNSIHTKTVLKQNPNIINERLNKRSSKEENFLEIKNEYELIMKKCGYDDKLKYENYMQKPKNNPKQKRKRNIIWYNPPFSNSVKTNIGRKFINLVKKTFH